MKKLRKQPGIKGKFCRTDFEKPQVPDEEEEEEKEEVDSKMDPVF